MRDDTSYVGEGLLPTSKTGGQGPPVEGECAVRAAAAALVASAALVATGQGGAALPTAADQVTGPDWSMELWVPETTWSELITTNFLACNDLTVRLTVSVAADVAWKVAGQIAGLSAGGESGPPLETFESAGIGPQDPPIAIPGITMCEHFNVPVTPQNHGYVATATATIDGVPQTTPTLEEPFTIGPMRSAVRWRSHEIRGAVSAVLGDVAAYTNDGFSRPAPVGTVTLQRLEGSTWLTAGETTSAADGTFAVTADGILQTGSYIRLQYPGDYWVAANDAWPVQVWAPWNPLPPPATQPPAAPAPPPVVNARPTPTVKVKAVSRATKLKVDVNPNKGSKYWTFQVQRLRADGSWAALKTYRTRGSKEVRVLDLRRGTYRVWVNPKFGYDGVLSASVTLRR